jgi:hypothetical protein
VFSTFILGKQEVRSVTTNRTDRDFNQFAQLMEIRLASMYDLVTVRRHNA